MTITDIVAELSKLVSGSSKDGEPIRNLFARFDLDGSGTISVSELRQVLASWGEPVSEHEAQAWADTLKYWTMSQDVDTYDWCVELMDGPRG